LGDAVVATDSGVDPLRHLPNLSDVMLVLAVALLVALISFWNVDVSRGGTPESSSLQPVEGDLSQGVPAESLSDGDYREVGTVYQDTATGEMYLLTD
jgi:hypothetical protein